MAQNRERNNTKESGQRMQMHYSPNLLGCINNAIDNTKIASLEYESKDNDVSERDVEPMALIFKNRKRHLVAYCHLRQEYRTFRLDRINLIKVNNVEFIPRDGFEAAVFEVDDEYSKDDNSSDQE